MDINYLKAHGPKIAAGMAALFVISMLVRYSASSEPKKEEAPNDEKKNHCSSLVIIIKYAQLQQDVDSQQLRFWWPGRIM